MEPRLSANNHYPYQQSYTDSFWVRMFESLMLQFIYCIANKLVSVKRGMNSDLNFLSALLHWGNANVIKWKEAFFSEHIITAFEMLTSQLSFLSDRPYGNKYVPVTTQPDIVVCGWSCCWTMPRYLTGRCRGFPHCTRHILWWHLETCNNPCFHSHTLSFSVITQVNYLHSLLSKAELCHNTPQEILERTNPSTSLTVEL